MSSAPGFRPLYQQVYDSLVQQISGRRWLPGTALPNEFLLAEEFGVSQGTIRKALNVLTAEKIIERRQGKGSYVAQHTQEKSLFRFFRIARPGGEATVPQPGTEKIRKRNAKKIESEKLALKEDEKIYEIRRVRLIDDEPAVSEIIIISSRLFPDLEKHSVLPNALYSLYQEEYGIQITSTKEELRGVLADKEDAKLLSVNIGDPLLQINRIAIALDGQQVEYRTTRCNTKDLVYSFNL